MTEDFARRKIKVDIQIAEGALGDTPGPVIPLENHRCIVDYLVYNGWMQGQLNLMIFGMPLDLIDQLTVIGPIMPQRRNNIVTVYAGDENSQLSVIYKGKIYSAYGDFDAAPENVFHLQALSVAFEAVKPAENIEKQGPFPINDVLKVIAGNMKLKLEDNIPAPIFLKDKYYYGDPVTQLKELCRDANINWTIERDILAVWPKDSARKVPPIDIGPGLGMVGYPKYSGSGVIIKCLFNPDIIQGGKINVISSLETAQGVWNNTVISHHLESEVPGGGWYTQVAAQRIGK